jgi:hypothetical protein
MRPRAALALGKRGGIHIAPAELGEAKARMERDDLEVLA